MKSPKRLGIFLDDTHANLIAFGTDRVRSTSLNQRPLVHNQTANQEHAAFYAMLAVKIKNCEDVLLFGPADTKLELLHLLRSNRDLDHVRIDLKTTESMSEQQQIDWVNKHFKSLPKLTTASQLNILLF